MSIIYEKNKETAEELVNKYKHNCLYIQNYDSNPLKNNELINKFKNTDITIVVLKQESFVNQLLKKFFLKK